MTYRVIWRGHLLDAVACAYLDALERGEDMLADAIGLATRIASERLATNPSDLGESREGYERVLVVEPLSVFYESNHDELVVIVVKVVFHRRGWSF
jgi:hypothetical protein